MLPFNYKFNISDFCFPVVSQNQMKILNAKSILPNWSRVSQTAQDTTKNID